METLLFLQFNIIFFLSAIAYIFITTLFKCVAETLTNPKKPDNHCVRPNFCTPCWHHHITNKHFQTCAVSFVVLYPFATFWYEIFFNLFFSSLGFEFYPVLQIPLWAQQPCIFSFTLSAPSETLPNPFHWQNPIRLIFIFQTHGPHESLAHCPRLLYED